MTSLVWFRRDLRISDNLALQLALQSSDPVIPVYIHDPEDSYDWSPGSASNWYLHQSICALKIDLATYSLPLVILKGPLLQTLLSFAKNMNAHRVVWNRIYEPEWQTLDTRIELALRETAMEPEIQHDHSLIVPGSFTNKSGTPYKIFTPFWRRIEPRILDYRPEFLGEPLFQNRVHIQALDERIPSLSPDELGLLDLFPWHERLHQYWTAGESAAQHSLSVAINHLSHYPAQRDFPATEGTTRLSTALHFGELSPWRVIDALRPAWSGEWGKAASRGAMALVRQLGWREFAIHQLNAYPRSPNQSIKLEFDSGAIWSKDLDFLRAWQSGRTGFALVDAGMRQLWETGWMHNRVRMITASFLSKHLGLHWRSGARWFWDTLVDADLSNNTQGWQWVAGCGCDAAPYYRIFNPERQAQRFDPEGEYVERWLGNTSTAIPEMIDLAEARDSALARYHRYKTQLGSVETRSQRLRD
jgi:deoxyribodipyrimidine photo-lyase